MKTIYKKHDVIQIFVPSNGHLLGNCSGAFKQTNEATRRPNPMGNTMTATTIPVDLTRPSAMVVVKKKEEYIHVRQYSKYIESIDFCIAKPIYK